MNSDCGGLVFITIGGNDRAERVRHTEKERGGRGSTNSKLGRGGTLNMRSNEKQLALILAITL